MLLRGGVPGAILQQSPCPVFKEGSEGGVLKWQTCVLKLVCGCNNLVFIGARSLYSLAWGLPGLGFVAVVVAVLLGWGFFCFFVVFVCFPLEGAKESKGASIYYCILIIILTASSFNENIEVKLHLLA